MFRYALVAVILALLLPASPSFALGSKEKMQTCKFGADHQKLEGKMRKDFLKRCMLNKNDPRGEGPAPKR